MRFQFLKPRRDVASAEQVRALRQRRGWTLDKMADEVHASALEVTAWEAGTVQVPAKQALLIRWMEDVDAWREALDAARSQSCDWVREHAPDLYKDMFRNPPTAGYAGNAPVHAHLAGCTVCQAARERALQLGGYPARPDTSGSLLARYRLWVDRLPRRVQAPFKAAGNAVELTLAIGIFFAFLAPDVWVGFLLSSVTWMVAWPAFERVLPWRLAGSLALVAGVVAGLLGWSLFPDNSLAGPLPWACAAAFLVVAEVSAAWSGKRSAKALAAKRARQASLPPPPPELAATHQPGDASAVPSTRPAIGVHGGDLEAIRTVVEAGRYEH